MQLSLLTLNLVFLVTFYSVPNLCLKTIAVGMTVGMIHCKLPIAGV